MKKALYVATVDIHIKSFHLPYLKMLKDMGYEVHVATNGEEQFPNCDKKHTICIERSPFKFKNIKAIKQLKNIIDKENYDLIHCHTPMGSVVTRLAAKSARKKGTRVIYTAHGLHFYKGAPLLNWLLFYPVEKYLSKYTDTLITINKEDYELANKKFKKTNIEYITGVGIDTKKFNFNMTQKEKDELRESLKLNKQDFVMLYAARLDKNKNQTFLINIMEELIKKYSNIHLLLAGNDELNGKYHKIVENKNLNKNIHFLGHRTDIHKLLKISNIAVSTSLREGLPVNVMEALISEIPIVALKCRGMEDLIKKNKQGFIVNNEEEFIEKIIEIYNNKIKIKLDKEIIKKINIENTLQEVKKIYKNKEGEDHVINTKNY